MSDKEYFEIQRRCGIVFHVPCDSDRSPWPVTWINSNDLRLFARAIEQASRRAALEEAAKVCDLLSGVSDVGAYIGAYGHAASRIRALESSNGTMK